LYKIERGDPSQKFFSFLFLFALSLPTFKGKGIPPPVTTPHTENLQRKKSRKITI
jgi:hypothetical protein